MRIVEQYSHHNGHECILVHHPRLWAEIEEAISNVDAEACKILISGGEHAPDRELFSCESLNLRLGEEFSKLRWEKHCASDWVTTNKSAVRRVIEMSPPEQKREIEQVGLNPEHIPNESDFLKDRIAIESYFDSWSPLACDQFVKHLSFFVGDLIDVGVEILPMKEMSAQMSSGISYYEGELYNVIRQGRGVPAVPLVLLGVAPDLPTPPTEN